MKTVNSLFFGLALMSLTSCSYVEHFEKRAQAINELEDKILVLSKENQEMNNKLMQANYKIKTLESKNYYLETQLKDKAPKKESYTKRTIASVARVDSNDLVKYDVYKWDAKEMVSIAQKEFDSKNYEKSAQFFNAYTKNFPNSKELDADFLFQAGVASYESGKHYDWSEKYFTYLTKKYPTSKYYLGAKLWLGMSYLKQNRKDEFFAVVEEFRKKYRNTPEWNILSGHYEKIVQKYKKN
ncbi:tetratricopeptide repeat protein [Halobacteriovorax sp. GFR7]|uniref:tetratricopeptide repeat protein n=1 Tax=unclassified Halobacteriovorax TaxID=2639665 RepID=UPI000CD1D797|nr:hypothetical protein [Halobacteriovorax sp. DA5]POB12606.1 hypothetical protein C0Z22_14875 [Halobacteriovorax sp. DA5]